MPPLTHLPREGRGPFRLWIPAFLGEARWGVAIIILARCSRDFEVEQPCGIVAEDRAALDIVEPRRAFDHANRIDLAHIGGIVGAHQYVVGAVFFDEIFKLMVGVDERIKIDPFQVGGRHPVDALAAIRTGRGGVVDAPRISR
jgi:hypothetical protein